MVKTLGLPLRGNRVTGCMLTDWPVKCIEKIGPNLGQTLRTAMKRAGINDLARQDTTATGTGNHYLGLVNHAGTADAVVQGALFIIKGCHDITDGQDH